MNDSEALHTNGETTQSTTPVGSTAQSPPRSKPRRRPGPQTSDAKAKVRLNAVRHGVCSTAPVIPGLERPEDWEAHRTGMLASLQPSGYLETFHAERAALHSWRLQRAAAYEHAQIVMASKHRKKLELPLPSEMDRIMRYEAHLNRQWLQTQHELEVLQKQRRGEATPLGRLDVQGMLEQ